MLRKLRDDRRPWTIERVRRGILRYGPPALLDALIVAIAYACALLLRLGPDIPVRYWSALPVAIALSALLFVVSNLFNGVYFRSAHWFTFYDEVTLTRAAIIATAIAVVADILINPSARPLPLSVILIAGLLSLFGGTLVRSRGRLASYILNAYRGNTGERLLIVGAGQNGQWLAHELLTHPALGYRPLGFIDDDPAKIGTRIQGLRVLGTRFDIVRAAREHEVDILALAIPSLTDDEQRELLTCCEEAPVRIKILPGIPDMLGERPVSAALRDVSIEDVLGRPPVQFQDSELRRQVVGETVLISGAAGSIGSELARQVRRIGPRRLVLLDNNETGLFDLVAELDALVPAGESETIVAVASVTDAGKIRRIFEQYEPRAVFHAAAYKHVPLMEDNADEAVKVNIGGTLNVCLAADAVGCGRVVFISTDKAVHSTNVMGASKRVGERLVQAFDESSPTIFCSVRFGNVLGSRGSVIPIFERQIQLGGPVTVTHPDATRYFMTIPEAANLIIEASCHAEGGETFLLDMGTSVNIDYLARRLIRLHGLRPNVDVLIEYTGLRPGEKLYESLTLAGEELMPTPHPKVSRLWGQAPNSLSRSALVSAADDLLADAHAGAVEPMIQKLWELAGSDRSAEVNASTIVAAPEMNGATHEPWAATKVFSPLAETSAQFGFPSTGAIP